MLSGPSAHCAQRTGANSENPIVRSRPLILFSLLTYYKAQALPIFSGYLMKLSQACTIAYNNILADGPVDNLAK